MQRVAWSTFFRIQRGLFWFGYEKITNSFTFSFVQKVQAWITENAIIYSSWKLNIILLIQILVKTIFQTIVVEKACPIFFWIILDTLL